MVRESSGKSRRRHRHTDYGRSARSLDEGDLLTLVEGLERPALLLILDQIQDPHNLGACLRSADGAGADAVIVPRDHSVGLTEAVRNVACGAAEAVSFAEVTNLARIMGQLKERGVWIVGADERGNRTIFDTDLTGPVAVALGAEGKGLRRLTREQCDFVVQIPMAGTVESLNVSVATGICLYEAVRQRRKGG